MERSRIIALAKKLKEVASELKQMCEEEKQLFESPIKEKIIASTKKNREIYIDAQDVIKEWTLLWYGVYKTQPIPQKNWVFMIAPILSRKTHTKSDLIRAVKNYFAEDSTYLHDQVRYSFPFFVSNINKYLALKKVVHEDVFE